MGARHIEKHKAPRGTAAHLHRQFHVVTAITNPRRWRTRYELYNDFREQVEKAGATLWTIECQYGRRAHALTEHGHQHHIQLRTGHELWHKENLLNVAISRLPADWRYVAWVDADIQFVRPDWINETVQMLQHHQVVQMFTEAHDLGPDYEVIASHESFCCSYSRGRQRRCFEHSPYGHGKKKGHHLWHPGFAWAARREALDHLGGLIDFACLGAGDNHMAHALIGDVMRSVHARAHPNYVKWLKRWEDRAERYIRRNIGCVDGTILHHYHGAKRNRKYASRWRIIVDNRFDPEVDLKRDVQGVWQLVDDGKNRQRKLRDDIRRYFVERREDDVCENCL